MILNQIIEIKILKIDNKKYIMIIFKKNKII